MMRYLLSVHSVEGEVREPMSAESATQVGILEEELKSAGAWVFSGRLHEPDSATVARVSGGEVLTTDGPFAESKEHLGGFYTAPTVPACPTRWDRFQMIGFASSSPAATRHCRRWR
jgi:hypothetical protein